MATKQERIGRALGRKIADLESQLAEARAENERLRAGVWVRCTSYHDRRADNASYFCGEYTHSFTVQVFAGDDPGDYMWDRRTPSQFRVKVPIEDA
jgi:hypothetical protein